MSYCSLCIGSWSSCQLLAVNVVRLGVIAVHFNEIGFLKQQYIKYDEDHIDEFITAFDVT